MLQVQVSNCVENFNYIFPNAFTETLQKVLEKPLEKKAGRNYGPSGNKTMIYFIDDLNAPQVSTRT